MLPFAVFSDIHANLEALETAVSWSEAKGIRRFAVLGDTVGYGANPNECFEWVQQHASVNLTGNHERALVESGLKEQFNPFARQAIEWTAEIIEKAFVSQMRDLSYARIEDGCTFVHGSVHEPEKFHYLFYYEDSGPSFKQMQTEICFVGHTHVPCCFSDQNRCAEYLKPGVRSIKEGERVILNPGSLGQPRDHDPRLSFGIYDPARRSFEVVRLEYDNRKAAGKIRKAGLPSYLADRLL